MTQETHSGPGDLAPGEQLAGYEIQERIGRGGMAVVYRALDLRLGRLVALKVLAPHLGEDDAFRQRFMRESRAAAGVEHPHIVPVFEAGEAAGVLFIAMRYVAGGDVRTLIESEGRLSPARTARIASQVASALDAAHAHGLVHRDVKPANILLGRDSSSDADHVYLSDFGLSKLAVSVSTLTSTGQFLGTLDYVAPEQIQGHQVDGRADQYGLACALVEMLTGAPPFRRDDSMALMWAQIEAPPPRLTERRSELPAEVDAVFAAAMSKTPAGRYASCSDFAVALAAALHSPQPKLSPAQSDRVSPTAPPADHSPWSAHPADRLPAERYAGGYADGGSPAEPFRSEPLRSERLAAGTNGLAVNQADRYHADGLVSEPAPRQAPSGPWSDMPQDWFRDSGSPKQAPDQAVGPGRRAGDGRGDDPVPVHGESFRQPSVHAAWPADPAQTRHDGYAPAPGTTQPGRVHGGRGGASRNRGRNVGIGLLIAFVGLCGVAGIAYKLSLANRHAHKLPPVIVYKTVTPGIGPDPAQTVRNYFADINQHRYLAAWQLHGGAATESYAVFRKGYAGTLRDKVTIQSVSGNVVTASLLAEQIDGTYKYYAGTYTVTNGIITATNVHRIK